MKLSSSPRSRLSAGQAFQGLIAFTQPMKATTSQFSNLMISVGLRPPPGSLAPPLTPFHSQLTRG